MTNRALRMTEEYAAWLEEVAAFKDRSLSMVLQEAVQMYAEAVGFGKKPPSRLGRRNQE